MKTTCSNHPYLAKELFAFARLEVESGKSHEQITKLGGAVVLTVCCVVLVEKCWSSQTLSRGLKFNKYLRSTDLCEGIKQRKLQPFKEAQ